MNRVAVITDIHGNLPALEATLDVIDQIGVEGVYCGGDLVGYGPHPNEVCRLIKEREIPTIYGSYDVAIARELDDCGCAYVTAHDRELDENGRVRASIERVPYDAEAVAREVEAAGLPGEYATKLVAAA